MSSVTTRDTERRDPGAAGADPTARERELLALTLDVLRERGYDGLTIDEVVARARASKTTIYRRWPSKGELVFAAVTWGIRDEVAAPDTGELAKRSACSLTATQAPSSRCCRRSATADGSAIGSPATSTWIAGG